MALIAYWASEGDRPKDAVWDVLWFAQQVQAHPQARLLSTSIDDNTPCVVLVDDDTTDDEADVLVRQAANPNTPEAEEPE